MPSTTVDSQRRMVLAALSLLFNLDFMESRLAVILLHHYMEGDSEVQSPVMNYLFKHGMVDPGGYFHSVVREMRRTGSISSLSVGSDDTHTHSSELLSLVSSWMQSRTEEFSWATRSKTAATKKPSKLVQLLIVCEITPLDMHQRSVY